MWSGLARRFRRRIGGGRRGRCRNRARVGGISRRVRDRINGSGGRHCIEGHVASVRCSTGCSSGRCASRRYSGARYRCRFWPPRSHQCGWSWLSVGSATSSVVRRWMPLMALAIGKILFLLSIMKKFGLLIAVAPPLAWLALGDASLTPGERAARRILLFGAILTALQIYPMPEGTQIVLGTVLFVPVALVTVGDAERQLLAGRTPQATPRSVGRRATVAALVVIVVATDRGQGCRASTHAAIPLRMPGAGAVRVTERDQRQVLVAHDESARALRYVLYGTWAQFTSSLDRDAAGIDAEHDAVADPLRRWPAAAHSRRSEASGATVRAMGSAADGGSDERVRRRVAAAGRMARPGVRATGSVRWLGASRAPRESPSALVSGATARRGRHCRRIAGTR